MLKEYQISKIKDTILHLNNIEQFCRENPNEELIENMKVDLLKLKLPRHKPFTLSDVNKRKKENELEEWNQRGNKIIDSYTDEVDEKIFLDSIWNHIDSKPSEGSKDPKDLKDQLSSEKFIDMIRLCSQEYSPGDGFSDYRCSRVFIGSDLSLYSKVKCPKYPHVMENFTSGLKFNKNVVAYGYHHGCLSLESPVSVLQIIEGAEKFIIPGFDLFRPITDVEFISEDDKTLIIKITVDNFSS
jgi:hypothetical protein